MKLHNQVIVSLRDMLLIDGKKIVDVENNIEEVLPEWISKISSKILKEELEHYLSDIRSHQKEMKDCEKNDSSIPDEYNSRIVKAYLDEANDKLSACADAKIFDAYLIYAIQAINHYKINIYGTLATYADSLGQQKTAEIYHKAMLDEKVSDMRLSNIAERNINVIATLTC
ncbi:DUF892 family protein [Chitinophagaceae bacterium LB-8]|uniref:DUF892 family protein n=1 Tax=Paraflavisolibacter caeni TaxID=2982496 RepID=A0A9X2XYI9_9BACT|nr:DUF892 family protein [Paraflavisolibacter caeni]MCU7551565.1 DUF892 family protein [Paraflavisolibacter caeni]